MFAPFSLRGMRLENRVVVSQMATYSAADGAPNDFHLFHYGTRAEGVHVRTKDGEEVGRITEISHLTTQDLFVVERPDGTEVYVPFVEEIVTEIDLEEQRAVIDPPPGLIDDRAEVASARDAEESGDDAR